MSEMQKVAAMCAISTGADPEATKKYYADMEKRAKEQAHRTRFHRLQLGDVFRWAKLADCVYGYKDVVDTKPKTGPATTACGEIQGYSTVIGGSGRRFEADPQELKLRSSAFDDSIRYTYTEQGKEGWRRRIEETLDLRATDPNRGVSEFIVVSAHRESGGCGHGPGDEYPDYWLVKARRLRIDGNFDPDGEEVSFSQQLSGGEIEPHRRMEMEFK